MKNNKNIIIKSLVVASALGISTASQAQWATINVGDVINRAIQQAGFNGTISQLAGLNISNQQMMVNQVKNQQDTDVRNRANTFQSEALSAVAPNIANTKPTLQQCIMKTQSSSKQSVVGGAGGGGGSPTNPERNLLQLPKDQQQIIGNQLNNKAPLQTCTPNDAGSGGCDGSTQKYAGGDIHPRGSDGAIDGTIPINTTGQLYKSYTLDGQQWPVATQYINNQTMYGIPKGLPKEEMEKNPQYNAVAIPIYSKLYAAQEALMTQARMKQPSKTPIQGTALEFWNNGADYSGVTGLKGPAPTNPSLYDVINYSVLNAFTGNTTQPMDQVEINKRLALNNLLLWKIYQQNEQMIRLQANSLVQQVTPVSVGNANFQATDAKIKAGSTK